MKKERSIEVLMNKLKGGVIMDVTSLSEVK